MSDRFHVRGPRAAALLFLAACGGVSNANVPHLDASTDVFVGESGLEPDDAADGTTCSPPVACGTVGALYQECTETSDAGVCEAIVYRVSGGPAFACAGCTSCGAAQQQLAAYCASGPSSDGGNGDASSRRDGGGSDTGVLSDASRPPDGRAEGGGFEGGFDARPETGPRPDATSPFEAGFEASFEAGVDACVGVSCLPVCVPGTVQCDGTEVELCDSTGQWGGAESDPIWAVEAANLGADGGDINTINFDGNNGESTPTSTQLSLDGDDVTFTVWTAPGMTSMAIGYWLDDDSGDVDMLAMTNVAIAWMGLDVWTVTLPAPALLTTVTWWAQGVDMCSGQTDYYSNAGNNYVFIAQ